MTHRKETPPWVLSANFSFLPLSKDMHLLVALCSYTLAMQRVNDTTVFVQRQLGQTPKLTLIGYKYFSLNHLGAMTLNKQLFPVSQDGYNVLKLQ